MKIKIYNLFLKKETIVLILFFSIVSISNTWSQTNPLSFNTAINASFNGVVPTGTNDASWLTSTLSAVAGFVPAKHWNNPTNWAVPPPGSNYDWITFPFTCNGNPTDHGCIYPPNGPTFEDVWFKKFFTITNQSYIIDLNMWSDNIIMDVYLNNNQIYSPSSPLNYTSYVSSGVQNILSCNPNYLIAGPNANYILVHTRSGPVTGPGLNYSGLMVQNNLPVMNISVPTPVCANSSAGSFSVFVSGATSYLWSFPSGWSGINTTQIVSPTTGPTPGTATIAVQAYNSTGSCLSYTTATVSVLPSPTITVVPSPPSVCPGFSTMLTASGASTYTWNPPVPPGIVNNNPIIVNPSGPPASYVVTGTGTNTCKASSSIGVNFPSPPNIIITAQSAVICDPKSNTLTATGATSYTWQPSGPNTSTWVITPPPPIATYSLKATAANGCTYTAAITLTLGPLIPLSVANATLCTDVSTCIVIGASTSFTPAYTYSWQPIAGSQSTLQVCPAASTNYSVTISSNFGCSTTSVIAVQVQTCCPPPTATFALPTSSYCNVFYNNLAQYASVTGTFSGVGVTLNPIGQYDFNFPVGLAPGVYTVAFTYTTAPWGCKYTLYQTVTISSPLPVNATAEPHCSYSQIPAALSATLGAVIPGTTYYWYPGGSSGQTIYVTPTVSTIYTVVAVYPGCSNIGIVQMLVNNNCCPQLSVNPVVSYTTLAAGSPTSSLTGPIVIDQDLTITGPGSFTFQTGAFIIADNVKIILKPGVNLVLTDAHLHACELLWGGIIVQDGANVTSAPGPLGLSTLIEDAGPSAIDVENATSNHAVPLLNLDGVIFNRNWYGISVANSTLSSIPLGIKSCVFTCRDLPYTNTSWPSSSATSPTGMRYSTVAATSLAPPFLLSPNYPIKPANQSLNQLSGGINIQNIKVMVGGVPTPGVSWGTTNPAEFNLFDDLQVGVYIYKASNTTWNNAFQNMGMTGIFAWTGGGMNQRLSLTPPNTTTGNRFWNNLWGQGVYGGGSWADAIIADSVLEFDVQYASFRGSSQLPGTSQGGAPIWINTNRFDNYIIQHNTFSNQPWAAIEMYIFPGFYLVNSFINPNGVYGGGMDIGWNFFSPEISATTPSVTGHSIGAVLDLQANGTSYPWTISGLTGTTVTVPNFIHDNILDRVEIGLNIQGMASYPLGVINNTIGITADCGFGISIGNSVAHKSIKNNLITITNGTTACGVGIGTGSNQYCAITCNTVTGGDKAFTFGGLCIGPWTGNVMSNNNYGLYLYGAGGAYTTSIGPQGSSTSPSGNQWLGNWSSAYATWIDPPASSGYSKLFVDAANVPLTNGGNMPYVTGFSLLNATGTYACPSSQLLLRSSAPGGIHGSVPEDEQESSTLSLYPNPTSGHVIIAGENETETLQVSVIDMTGKIVYSQTLVTTGHKVEVDLAFPQGIYVINILDQNNKTLRKKLIIE